MKDNPDHRDLGQQFGLYTLAPASGRGLPRRLPDGAVILDELEKLAREWGLFVSGGRGKTSVGIEEPALFSEPGVFLVRPDATLYSSSIQTMPFVRPRFDEMVKALETIIGRDYPARGEA